MSKKQESKSVATIQRELATSVQNRIGEYVNKGELNLPKNYSIGNALKAAFLQLQEIQDKNKKPVLESCTKASIYNSLLNMAIQGLNPAKQQCYFIAYGNKLICQRSSFGTQAIFERVTGASVYAQVVYEDDKIGYQMDKGRIISIDHQQDLTNIDSDKIVAAYAVIEFPDNRPDHIELMTFDQIKQSWKQGSNYSEKGNGTHQKFPEEMCKKTVINRACKRYINASTDESLVLQAFNRTDTELAEDEAQQAISDNANTIDIDEEVNQETGEVTETSDDYEDVPDIDWDKEGQSNINEEAALFNDK